MTEFNPQSDQNAPPEDVATLYSWANLHGAKYRDFSAARAQTREKARLRAEQAGEEEQRQDPEEVQSADAGRAAEEEYLAVMRARKQEQARLAELAAGAAARQAERAAQQAAEEEAHRAAQEAAEQAARLEAEQAARQAARAAAELAAKQAVERAARMAQEQRVQEQQAQEQQAQEQRVREQRIREQRAQEQAAQERRVQEQRAQEQRAQEQRAQEQRAQEQAAQEQRAQEQRAQEQAAEEQRAQERAAQLAAQKAADRAAEQAALAAAQHLAQQRAAWQQPQPPARTDRFPAAPPAQQPPNYPLPAPNFAGYGQPQAYRPATTPSSQPQFSQSQSSQPQPSPPHFGPPREPRPTEESPMPRSLWTAPEVREPAGRPAWLSPEAPQAPAAYLPVTSPPPAPASIPPSSVPLAPEDTLQGSRDRLTSRWFALRGVFDGTPAQPEAVPAPVVSRAPAMAMFSLAGGVGKTSLVATLGRALSARGERVLLVDTAAFGLLPFFFGATDQRPGLLRTFSPPGVSSDAPIQMVTIDPEGLGSEIPESLSGEISKFARGASRVIVDLATASGATTRRIMRMAPLVLVPVIPDMNSVVSVSSIDAFFEHNSNPAGTPAMPYYVLNQFDASLPLHLDVREVLREQLGERLLPFALRRTPAMSEALAEGMTVMDYAPGSPLAEDFTTLAAWVKSLSAPATTSYRGVRWSER